MKNVKNTVTDKVLRYKNSPVWQGKWSFLFVISQIIYLKKIPLCLTLSLGFRWMIGRTCSLELVLWGSLVQYEGTGISSFIREVRQAPW